MYHVFKISKNTNNFIQKIVLYKILPTIMLYNILINNIAKTRKEYLAGSFQDIYVGTFGE